MLPPVTADRHVHRVMHAPRAWRRHGEPHNRLDAMGSLMCRKLEQRMNLNCDDPSVGYAAFMQTVRRRQAIVALIATMIIVDEPSLASEGSSDEPAPLVDQLVDDLVLAPSAPPRRGATLLAA